MAPVSKERFVLTMFLVKHIYKRAQNYVQMYFWDRKIYWLIVWFSRTSSHVLTFYCPNEKLENDNSVALVVLSDAPIIVSIYSHKQTS